MASAAMHTEVEKRLADIDARYTLGRRAVVSALAGADGPRSAAELHDDLGRDVPLSSLYRTLSVLEQAEIVAPHHGARSITRYELAEWLTGHHHHLVCLECGAVEDVDVPERVESEVRSLVAGIAGRAFEALGHSLEIEGRCARCA